MDNKNQNVVIKDKAVESPEIKSQPKVLEKEIIYKKRRGGCLGTGIGCQAIGCVLMLIIFVCCLSSIFIIINRPAFIWDRVVTLLNQGIVLPEYHPASASYVEENLISDLRNGQNDIYISADQLTTIARDKFPQFKDLNFIIENGELTMLWALDQNPNPVFGVIKMKIDNNNITISKIGTPNISLPAFANEAANKLVLSILNLNSKDGNGNILSALLNDSSNLKINKIEFQKDKLYLDVFIDVNLFN